MMYEIQSTSEFRKGYKSAKKRGRNMDALAKVIDTLAEGRQLPDSNRDHQLIGNFRGCRECHVEPDWLLVYRIDKGKLVLMLVATGTHSDLFKKVKLKPLGDIRAAVFMPERRRKMATIASTITLRDNMTAVLNRQADAANTLLRRFTNLDRTTDSYDPSGQFISANSAILEMNANLGVQTTLLQQQNSLLANMVEQSAAAAREANNSKDAWGGVGNAIKAAMSFLSVKAVKDFVDNVFALSNTQLKAEVQLATVMNNQGSGAADFEAIKTRTSEIQGRTMFGDEAMISGAAELSIYISDTEAISHMMGTLADYAAGMIGGAEVGVEAMTEYATQLGKALDGTYDGLKKKGFELTEEQQNIIENGTDMQKALVLDDVISQSGAGLAENMWNTPTGAITSLNNTIGDIGETIGARITPAFMTLADKVDAFVNGAGFESLVGVLTTLFDVLSWGAGVVQWAADNWGALEPVLWAIVTAVVAYNAAQGIYNVVTAAASGLSTLHAAALSMQQGATFGATVSQYGFNAALLACPVTWIVLGIGALVGALAVFTNHVNQAYGLSLSFSGMLGGVTLAALGNMVIMIYNRIVENITILWNYIGLCGTLTGSLRN